MTKKCYQSDVDDNIGMTEHKWMIRQQTSAYMTPKAAYVGEITESGKKRKQKRKIR